MAVYIVPTPLQQGLAVTDSPTFAALTLTSPLTVPSGGTGLVTLAAGRIPYGAGAAAFASSAALTYDGTSLAVTTAGPHAFGGAVGVIGGVLQALGVEGSIGLLRSANPGDTATENFIAFYGYTATGGLVKTGSISDLWVDTANASGYSVLRLNSSYQVAGVTTDENAIVSFGGRGVYLWAPAYGPGNAPGDKVLRVDGTVGIGQVPTSNSQMTIGGAFAPASGPVSTLDVATSVTMAANQVAYGLRFTPTFIEAGSGTHAVLAGIYVSIAVTAGVAATTLAAQVYLDPGGAPSGTVSAAGLYVAAAPTGATNNYAVWVAGGLSKFDAIVSVSGSGGATVASMVGIELRGGTTPSLTAYSRTAVAYLPMVYDALSHQFSTGAVVVDSAGPHAIGGAANGVIQLILEGTFAASTPRALSVNTTLVPSAGQPSYGLVVTPTINIAGSGVHALFVGIYVDGFTVGAGVGTLTTAASLYIAAAPTGGTSRYALFSDAGLNRFDGDGTDVFELPADATDPTGGGGAAAGRVPVRIGGATKYLAYY